MDQIENSIRLVPQRQLRHITTQSTVTNQPTTTTQLTRKARPRIQVATQFSIENDDLLHNERIMTDACHVWMSSMINGDEYTPPWIRVPEELQVNRRQRMISHPIEIYPQLDSKSIQDDMSFDNELSTPGENVDK